MHVGSAPGEGARPEPEGRTVLLVNVHARTGERRFEAVRDLLARERVRVDEAVALQRPTELQRVVRDALEEGTRRVLVGGGDGTLSCASRLLAGTDAVLGVIPLGTGNDFARSLGLPLDLEGAARVVRDGVVHTVDVGLANGRPFLNAASVGLTVAMARRLTARLKRWAGRLAYPVAAAQEALDFRPIPVRLTVDGQQHTLHALQLVVGNGRFHGAGNLIAPEASLEDSQLHVYAILAHGARQDGAEASGPDGLPALSDRATLQDLAALAQVSLKLRRGTHVEHPDVLALRGRDVLVETADRPHRVNVDGEMVGRTPVRFQVWPRALRVLAPPAGPHVPTVH